MLASQLIRDIQTHGLVKFGHFTLKNGGTSSFYLDFREGFGYPSIFKAIARHMALLAQTLEFDLVCGIPDAAIPLATTVAMAMERPFLLCRKQIKEHGRHKRLEGVCQKGQRCLLVEDVITTGGSILEIAQILRHEGMVVEDCVAVVCRERSGIENLRSEGIRLQTVFELEQLLERQEERYVE